jgi:integration host factor subunit beta
MQGTEPPKKEKRARPKRILTLTRKDVERKMEDKLLGKKVTRKLIVDSLFDSMRELIMTADPVVRIEIREFGVFEVKKNKTKTQSKKFKNW